MPEKLGPSPLAKGEGLDKKSILYLIIVTVLAAFVSAGSLYLLSQMPEIKEEKKPAPARRTMEEIIRSLTAPSSGKGIQIPEEVIRSLSAPLKKGKEISEDVLKNLTAPE